MPVGAARPVPRGLVALVGVALLASGCAASLGSRPATAGTEAPVALLDFRRVTRACAAVRTMTAELALSGRAGRERLRGRVVAGLAAGGQARLEGLAPFGPPLLSKKSDRPGPSRYAKSQPGYRSAALRPPQAKGFGPPPPSAA